MQCRANILQRTNREYLFMIHEAYKLTHVQWNNIISAALYGTCCFARSTSNYPGSQKQNKHFWAFVSLWFGFLHRVLHRKNGCTATRYNSPVKFVPAQFFYCHPTVPDAHAFIPFILQGCHEIVAIKFHDFSMTVSQNSMTS